MGTYCDIYGYSGGSSCRKTGAASAMGRKYGRTETFYPGGTCRKHRRNAPDITKWRRHGVFIRLPYGKRGDRCLRREIHSICRRKRIWFSVCTGTGERNGRYRRRDRAGKRTERRTAARERTAGYDRTV